MIDFERETVNDKMASYAQVFGDMNYREVLILQWTIMEHPRGRHLHLRALEELLQARLS